MVETYIKLYRRFTDWEWFGDGNMVRLFIYLLTNAQYKDTRYKGIEVKRGQILVGRKRLANELNLSERTIRTCLNRLKSTNELTIQSTNRYSLITIVKYDFYQGYDVVSDQQNDHQAVTQTTSNRPATDQQPTTIQERNKERKKEIEREIQEDIYSLSVMGFDEEASKLTAYSQLYDLDMKTYSKIKEAVFDPNVRHPDQYVRAIVKGEQ